jgi:hypothetical protein
MHHSFPISIPEQASAKGILLAIFPHEAEDGIRVPLGAMEWFVELPATATTNIIFIITPHALNRQESEVLGAVREVRGFFLSDW